MTKYHGPGLYLFEHTMGYISSKKEYDYLIEINELKGKLKKTNKIISKLLEKLGEK
jgi:hypothetical protein